VAVVSSWEDVPKLGLDQSAVALIERVKKTGLSSADLEPRVIEARPIPPEFDIASFPAPTWDLPRNKNRVHPKTDEPALWRTCGKCGASPGSECTQTGKHRFHKVRLGE